MVLAEELVRCEGELREEFRVAPSFLAWSWGSTHHYEARGQLVEGWARKMMVLLQEIKFKVCLEHLGDFRWPFGVWGWHSKGKWARVQIWEQKCS
jgi:hypothetical protein